MPVEIPSVRAEVTENGKKNHVLHSMVFMDRIPTPLQGEKLLSKLYQFVLTLEVGDFKAS